MKPAWGRKEGEQSRTDYHTEINLETLIDASKEAGLEANTEKT
jgi:hypothetical protein